MALMNINIGSVPIDLIKDYTTTDNSCKTVHEFTIQSTEDASIAIDITRVSGGDIAYDFFEYYLRGSWHQVDPLADGTSFTMINTTTVPVRVHQGNAMVSTSTTDSDGNEVISTEDEVVCNNIDIKVTDSTNVLSDNRRLIRCDDYPRCPSDYEPTPNLTVDNTTNVYIFFDSSGSMDSTLTPLQEMRDTLLKDALLPYYDNNETTYNERVKVISDASERTLYTLDIQGVTPTDGKIISLVFQDEADSPYGVTSSWTYNNARTAQFDSDMSALRTRLDSYPAEHYRGVIFQVATGTTGVYDAFKSFIKALQYGSGNYSGTNGFSNRDEFNYKFDVTPGSTAEYYKDLVVAALEELGFTI